MIISRITIYPPHWQAFSKIWSLYYGLTWAKIREAMCLAIPVKIVSIDGDEAETEIAGVRRRVSIALTPEAKLGDYVLLHTGYAIGVIDEAEAEETLKLLEEIASLSEVR
jgi:hydrogenase expression/formation protein HypC